MKYLAIFDYCDTLFDGQSLQLFIDYLFSHTPKRKWRKFFATLQLRNTHEIRKYKSRAFAPYRGLPKAAMIKYAKDFFYTVLWPKHHDRMLQRLKEHHLRGDIIIVISGGLEEYLQFLIKEIPVDRVISSRLLYHGEKFAGDIKEPECLGEEKVRRLYEEIDMSDFDCTKSTIYSDSQSDIPLLNQFGNAVVVGKSPQAPDWLLPNYQYLQL